MGQRGSKEPSEFFASVSGYMVYPFTETAKAGEGQVGSCQDRDVYHTSEGRCSRQAGYMSFELREESDMTDTNLEGINI